MTHTRDSMNCKSSVYLLAWYPMPEMLPIEIQLLIAQFAFDPYKDPW